jgi:nucleoside-diphosphate-sugar epimerase
LKKGNGSLKMKNILVTGGCGYIGTILTESLLEAGHCVNVYDLQWFGNYLTPQDNLTVLKGDVREVQNVPMAGMDAVIHLANVANDPCAELSPKLTWEVNALATMALVERAIEHRVPQFIYASSGSVYGVKDEPEVTEDLSLVPISDYNKAKMISERVLLSYKDRISIQIIRPATVCGFSPRMRLDLSVNILTWSALRNGCITVFGGSQTRPNIHIRDMVRVYHHFLNRPELRGIYNAGFENLSIMEIAEMVAERIPSKIEVSSSNDPRSYRLCSTKLTDTGFSPKWGVDDAIGELIEKHRNNELFESPMYYNIKAMKELDTIR